MRTNRRTLRGLNIGGSQLQKKWGTWGSFLPTERRTILSLNTKWSVSVTCDVWRVQKITGPHASKYYIYFNTILPEQNKMYKTKNENRFEHCWNHDSQIGFVHSYRIFATTIISTEQCGVEFQFLCLIHLSTSKRRHLLHHCLNNGIFSWQKFDYFLHWSS